MLKTLLFIVMISLMPIPVLMLMTRPHCPEDA